jgi:superoxide dismutase, Cu-Zn family
MKTLINILGLGTLLFSVACQTQSANQRAGDAELSAAVKSKLVSETGVASLTELDVQAEKGKVSLNGEVESEEVKRLSEKTALGVNGVSQVVNNLKVKPKANTAEANFIDFAGNPVGTALLTEESAGVRFHFTLNRLPAGTHGIHVHEKGDCTKPDFKSAGKHFNPEAKQHGAENPKGFHAGDLGNIEVGSDGTADVEVTAPQLTLKPSDHSLIRPGGTAIIIHAGRDDQKSDPSGNSGNPIACGVIDKAAFTHTAIHSTR